MHHNYIMSQSKAICPKCWNKKLPWFSVCMDCHKKENQKPTCEVCWVDTPEWHTLCKIHWKEKYSTKRHLDNIDRFKERKEVEYKEKFQWKYYFNSQKVKSKSELLICYFLTANSLNFSYEHSINIKWKEVRPDFVIDDGKGNIIILEHYWLDSEAYLERREKKENLYSELPQDFYYIWTEEEDMYNLKDRLWKKLNDTPLNKIMWK